VSKQQADQISTPMVAALELAWADIRAHHDEIPPAVIVLVHRAVPLVEQRLARSKLWTPDHPDAGVLLHRKPQDGALEEADLKIEKEKAMNKLMELELRGLQRLLPVEESFVS
jgi:hypothetical protein